MTPLDPVIWALLAAQWAFIVYRKMAVAIPTGIAASFLIAVEGFEQHLLWLYWLGAGNAALGIVTWWFWKGPRGGRKITPKEIGEKSRALRNALVRRMRDLAPSPSR
jgi:hypothetical protein